MVLQVLEFQCVALEELISSKVKPSGRNRPSDVNRKSSVEASNAFCFDCVTGDFGDQTSRVDGVLLADLQLSLDSVNRMQDSLSNC